MIIGLLGFAGSGKSEVAKFLWSEYGFKRINFKDSLVKEMKQRLPLVLELIAQKEYASVDAPLSSKIKWLFVDKPPLMRALLQNYGTELRRRDNPDYWVEQWTYSLSSAGRKVVADDVRFTNEADAVLIQGGILVKVEKAGLEPKSGHTSETEHLKIKPDFVVRAEPGDLEHLRKQVRNILDTVKAD